MRGTLAAMGMVSAFRQPGEPGGADFGGITASKGPDERLYVSDVVHKAFVSVGEKGTEAAAATAIMIEPEAELPPRIRMISFIPTFCADRPFLFLIRDRRSGNILFLGQINDPTS